MQGLQTKTSIAGIYDSESAGSDDFVVINSAGQLQRLTKEFYSKAEVDSIITGLVARLEALEA